MTLRASQVHWVAGGIRARTSRVCSNFERDVKAHYSNVCFGSKADICSAKSYVRFAPESGHRQPTAIRARFMGRFVGIAKSFDRLSVRSITWLHNLTERF
jgi:hypothetical protein